MRMTRGIVAAAVIGTVTLVVAPASAQVGVEVDLPGVSVGVGEREYRYRERAPRREYRVYEENRSECRTRTVRHERADGTVVERRERRCD